MRLQHLAALMAAFLFAALVPALAFALFAGSSTLLPFALVVTLAHAVLFGLPLFLLLRAKGWINLLTCIGGGFLIGAIPLGVVGWPLSPSTGSNIWVAGVPTVVDGIPTAAGWMRYGIYLMLLGVDGALGGLVFWLALRRLGAAQRSAVYSLAAVALLLTGALFAIPSITKDRTCHNMFRDGRIAIAPQLNFTLEIGIGDWQKLIDAMKDLKAPGSRSLRSDKNSILGFDTLTLSLCSEAGYNISATEIGGARREPATSVNVLVYEMTPGSGWQEPVREIVARLEALWPGKIQFKDSNGKTVPKPKELAPN